METETIARHGPQKYCHWHLCRTVGRRTGRPDPVRLMPDTHKVIFDNSFVRVVEGRVPAGGTEIKHRHPRNVMVFLADFDAEVRTFPDGKWTPTH